jgi:hypothetical protein
VAIGLLRYRYDGGNRRKRDAAYFFIGSAGIPSFFIMSAHMDSCFIMASSLLGTSFFVPSFFIIAMWSLHSCMVMSFFTTPSLGMVSSFFVASWANAPTADIAIQAQIKLLAKLFMGKLLAETVTVDAA